jgi:hypothetical protein
MCGPRPPPRTDDPDSQFVRHVLRDSCEDFVWETSGE